jgi:hypothetical protein
MNEFEAHESSYDHQHKKRLKEMKEMQKQVKDSVPRKEERGPLMSIKLGGGGKEKGSSGAGAGGGGFKKGGFKKMNAFVAVDGDDVGDVEEKSPVISEEKEVKMAVDVDSDVTDEGDYYDPRMPTGCHPGCAEAHTK